MRSLSRVLFFIALSILLIDLVSAEVAVPNIFCDHMVLQRDQENKVWGKAAPGEKVTVKINGQSHETTGDDAGLWDLMLEPLAVGGPHELVISGKNEIRIKDVLVGEVWICSGQSNMAWVVNNTYDADLTKTSANLPQIRMLTYPRVGSQEPVWTHDNANWQVCSADTVGKFSAVGYFFGRQLHDSLDVPIGLITNSWGGSAADAWVNRDVLEANEDYQATIERWKKSEQDFEDVAQIKERSEQQEKKYQALKKSMSGQQRPSNIYYGVLKSHLGYGIKGAIWYQGESNTGRAYQYRYLFPMMISNWRDEWKQGDFPFYWVQLADCRAEEPQPGESNWAELREAQTMTMSKLKNTGEAVIIDAGEGKDIHPRNKEIVGERLARWALSKEYGFDIAHHSPMYQSMEKRENSLVLTFDHIHKGWRPFDTKQIFGFAIAGEDKKFHWADAKVIKNNRIEVSSSQVKNPQAVRYGWADNPVCNLYDGIGLPLTPFRTDDWPGLTVDAR